MIAGLASAGVFFAVPVVGRLVLGPLRRLPAIARPSLWIAAGVAIWSVPLMGSLMLGVYRPEYIGAVGWLTVAVLAARPRSRRPRIPRLTGADRFALIGILLAAALTAAFPTDPFTNGWDMGTYATHAVHMANNGRLDVPYPWPAGDPVPPGFIAPGNLFVTQPAMTVRFSNLWPAWLAQSYGAAGYDGLVRLNVIVSVFSLLAVYGLARRLVNPRVAALAIVLLAFNPAQIWTARQTLSEVPTQFLIWCGLLLLVAYLARARRSWGLWAGILFGIAVLARIDALLMVPFLVAGHALWVVLRPARPLLAPRNWRHVYLGAVPLLALALAYYALFSRPYFEQLTSQLLGIGALTAGAVVLLVLTRYPPVVRFARFVADRRELVVGLLVILAALTAHAYFLRPNLPPFERFNVPGAPYDGARTYIEDALPNVGRYLTPGVVWTALLGWSILLLAATRRRGSAVLVPLLIVALGWTAAYAWNQAVWPNHFWAIRRFIPVIIPALVIFAGIGAAVLLGRLSKPGRRLAAALIVPLLAAFTVWIGAPMYVLAERQGSYEALADFAADLPGEGEIVALDGVYEGARFWMPLYLAFDRPIVPLDPATVEGRAEAMARLRAASSDNPLLIVTAAYDFRMDAVVGTRTAQADWTTRIIAETVYPVPRTVIDEPVSLTMIEATGLNTIGVRFGGPPQWVAPSSGFHPAQLIDGRPLRWTDGHGRISIPIEGDVPPAQLQISIADTGPVGGPLRIVLHGVTLFDGAVAAGRWSAEYDLAGLVDLRPGDTAEVEIISGTFVRDPVDQVDHETRFGVQVEAVILLADEH